MAERELVPEKGWYTSITGKFYIEGVEQNRENFNNNVLPRLAPSEMVLKAMQAVDRKEFASKKIKQLSYVDGSIPIGEEATISQPSLIARMIDVLDLSGQGFVLEIGTASGYTSAVLSKLAARVDTVERNQSLAKSANVLLKKLGFSNVYIHSGDGAEGFSQKAPYDSILVTAAVKQLPQPLINQLAEGGRIVAPVGIDPEDTYLTVSRKINGNVTIAKLDQVWFMPLVSEVSGGWKSEEEFEAASIIGKEIKKQKENDFYIALGNKAGVQPGALIYAAERLDPNL